MRISILDDIHLLPEARAAITALADNPQRLPDDKPNSLPVRKVPKLYSLVRGQKVVENLKAFTASKEVRA